MMAHRLKEGHSTASTVGFGHGHDGGMLYITTFAARCKYSLHLHPCVCVCVCVCADGIPTSLPDVSITPK